MDENVSVQNAANESPTSQEPEMQQEEIGGETPATAPQEQEAPAGNSAQAEENADNPPQETPEEPFLTVQYNHEDRHLTREEAEKLARHGIYYDSMYNKLDYIAAQSDITVDALLDKMLNSLEENKRAELAERFGDDEDTVNGLMELFRNKQKEKYEKAVADRKTQNEQAEQNANARLAEEFSDMKKLYPELTDFSSLPTEVKRAAAEGISLEHAYLRFQHSEKLKTDAAAESARKAAEASTGSMSSEKENKDSLLDDFIKEFRK